MNTRSKHTSVKHRVISFSAVLLATIISLSSCIKDDDDDSTLTDDMAITSFTLGTMNRYLHTTSSAGADSVYKKTYAGSGYAMAIDQYANTITNVKPLPTGTDLEHVICTIGKYDSSSLLKIKSLTSDSLSYYSSSDSINFSLPRELIVYAADGSGYRTYTVTLTVSSDDEDAFTWEETSMANVPAAISHAPAYVVSRKDASAFLLSADGGSTWTEQPIAAGEDQELLPQTAIAYTSWITDNSTGATYEMLVGSNSLVEDNDVVWRRIEGSAWVYMPLASNNPYGLKKTDTVSLACYDSSVLALLADGTILQSRDQGITWKENDKYTLPDGATAGQLYIGSDAGYLWLVSPATSQAWKGK